MARKAIVVYKCKLCGHKWAEDDAISFQPAASSDEELLSLVASTPSLKLHNCNPLDASAPMGVAEIVGGKLVKDS